MLPDAAPPQRTLVEQLRALAGVREGANEFQIVRHGCPIRVCWSPGSTDSLDLYAPVGGGGEGARLTGGGYRGAGSARPLVAPRPMRIALRRETVADGHTKAAGINREFQTGDEDFDARVYIDSPSEDPVLRAVLASPDARAAALDLLARDCNLILIDDAGGNVALSIVEFAERAPDQTRAERLVDNLVRLASALPQVRASGAAPVHPTTVPVTAGCALALIGVVAVPFVYLSVSPDRCVESDGDGASLVCSAGPECCTPGLVGLAGGVLASLPFLLIFGRVIRGRSNSSQARFAARAAALCVCAALGVIVARLAW